MLKPRIVTCLLALCFAGTAYAKGDPPASGSNPLAETVKEVKKALSQSNYVAVTNACARAKALRPKFTGKQFRPLVRAIAAGAKHRDVSIAIVSVKTLGELGVDGSANHLRSLLSPPKKAKPEKWNLYLAAIDAAGKIHDAKMIPTLEKLLHHPTTDFAVAGAKALAAYKKSDQATRKALVKRLATTLGRFEKAKPRTNLARAHHGVVKEALIETLRTVTNDTKLTTADDARAWLSRKEQSTDQKGG